MNKQEFLLDLRDALCGLPQQEIEDRLSFYSEMIDDQVEDGFSEQDALKNIGSIEQIATQIIKEVSLYKIAKENIKPNRKLKAWEIVLITIGSPVWIPLLISALAVIFSFFVTAFAIIISFWAVFGALAVSSLGGILSACGFLFDGLISDGISFMGLSAICMGLSIFAFIGVKALTKLTILLTKKIIFNTKKLFMKKEKKDNEID